MKRRTMMRKIGAAGVVTTALSGASVASRPATVADLGLDRELDVSSVDGWVAFEELLEPAEVASLPAGVDSTERIFVAPDADVIVLDHCCTLCCSRVLDPPDCECFTCSEDACTSG